GQSVRVPPLGGGSDAAAPAAREARDSERGPRAPRSPDAPRGGEAKAARPPSDAAYLRSLLLHEDDEVFVFNKPAGLAVQGGSGLSRHVDGMLAALTDRKGQKPRLVHRLDRDT